MHPHARKDRANDHPRRPSAVARLACRCRLLHLGRALMRPLQSPGVRASFPPSLRARQHSQMAVSLTRETRRHFSTNRQPGTANLVLALSRCASSMAATRGFGRAFYTLGSVALDVRQNSQRDTADALPLADGLHLVRAPSIWRRNHGRLPRCRKDHLRIQKGRAT